MSEQPQSDPLKVLVIDDDELVRQTISAILQRRGFQVVLAEDGDAGLEKYQSAAPDVVITDILMPGKEGIETIVELRRLSPSLKIIAISGGGVQGNLSYLDMARRLGANDVLVKPFTPDAVVNAVRGLFEPSA